MRIADRRWNFTCITIKEKVAPPFEGGVAKEVWYGKHADALGSTPQNVAASLGTVIDRVQRNPGKRQRAGRTTGHTNAPAPKLVELSFHRIAGG
jgi:hypothetical protein